MTGLDMLVLAVYFIAIMGMGLWLSRKNESTEDFFVGGRRMPAWAIGVSIFASVFSTITYLGLPGEMFRSGLGYLVRHAALPIVLPIIWWLWIPFFMRLKLTSVYEYLEVRFDRRTRQLASCFCLLLLLGWLSVVVLTASQAAATIANVKLSWFFGASPPDTDIIAMIVAVGVFSTVYTTLGGMRAVVWTDVIQFAVLLGGALFAMTAVAVQTGSGPADWLEVSSRQRFEKVEFFSFDPTTRSTIVTIIINYMFWDLCTHGANQVTLQRYFSVASAKAAQRSFLINSICSVILAGVLAGTGLSLMYLLQSNAQVPDGMQATRDALHSSVDAVRHTAQDRAFPDFIRHCLPSGLRGLVLAALFAAAMSTIDSGANSISTIVLVDFIRPVRKKAVTPAGELRTARILTASMGLVVVVISVGLFHLSKETNLIDLCQRGFNCFLGPLGGLFVLAMFSKRATPRTVIPAVLIGEVAGVLIAYSRDLFGYPISTHWVVPSAWLTTILVSQSLSLLTSARATDTQRKWMWHGVVRGATTGDGAAPLP